MILEGIKQTSLGILMSMYKLIVSTGLITPLMEFQYVKFKLALKFILVITKVL